MIINVIVFFLSKCRLHLHVHTFVELTVDTPFLNFQCRLHFHWKVRPQIPFCSSTVSSTNVWMCKWRRHFNKNTVSSIYSGKWIRHFAVTAVVPRIKWEINTFCCFQTKVRNEHDIIKDERMQWSQD